MQSETGEIFTGACIDAAGGIGFCAEHAAISQMLKKHQTRIVACVAVRSDGTPLAPCGRCRELMYQMNPDNMNATLMIADGRTAALRELLPER